MATETLHIENFAGIKNADIELGTMNVFIGPQASGKSVCAKILYFFKQCFATLAYQVALNPAKSAISTAHKETFVKYFPQESWSRGVFRLRYSYNDIWIEIVRRAPSSSTIIISYSSTFDKQLNLAKTYFKKTHNSENFMVMGLALIGFSLSPSSLYFVNAPSLVNQNYFVPSGRSFFSILQSGVFQFIANDLDIDPFLVEFGSFYESIRRWLVKEDIKTQKRLKSFNNILCGEYYQDAGKNKDYIVMHDSRKVPLEICSSGQQETLPLVLGLLYLSRGGEKAKSNTIFIEEPEAHLYPSAQRETVHLIAATIDFVSEDSTSQCVITTHSPYILTALNNLMYASRIAEGSLEKRAQVTKVLDETVWLPPSKVRAYFFENGKVRSIIDPETQLILASELDSVSDDISVEFDKLLSIEYREAAA